MTGCSRRPARLPFSGLARGSNAEEKGVGVTVGVLDNLLEGGAVTAYRAKQAEPALAGIQQVEAAPGRLRQVNRVATKDIPSGPALAIDRSTAREL